MSAPTPSSSSAAADAASSPSASPSPPSPPSPPLSLPVFSILRTLHAQHGLRHGDFTRYHAYCTRRLRRLRVALHLTKLHKYQQNSQNHKEKDNSSKKQSSSPPPPPPQKIRFVPLNVSSVTSPSHLIFLLTHVERCWSSSQQIRGQMEINADNRRLKFHAIGRMRKAVGHAETFLNFAEKTADALTTLQAAAYLSDLKGHFYFLRDRHADALKEFSLCTQILGEILKGNLGGAELSALAEERKSALSDHVRISEFLLAKSSASSPKAATLSLPQISVGLSEKVDALRSAKLSEDAKTLENFKVDGVDIPILNEKLRVCLLQILSEEKAIDAKISAKTADGAEDAEDDGGEEGEEKGKAPSLSSMFSKVNNLYDESLRILSADLPTAQLDSHKHHLQTLQKYLTAQKLWAICKRNSVILKDLHKRAEDNEVQRVIGGAVNSESKEKENPKEKSVVSPNVRRRVRRVRPDDVVVLLEKLLGTLTELSDLATQRKIPSEVNSTKLTHSVFSALRVVWLANSFRKIQKDAESLALHRRAEGLFAEIQKKISAGETLKVIDESDFNDFVNLSQRAFCRSLIDCAKNSAQSDSKESAGENPTKGRKEISAAPFFVSSAVERCIPKDSENFTVKLFEFPIPQRALPNKSTLFDLAFNEIQNIDTQRNLLETIKKHKDQLNITEGKQEEKVTQSKSSASPPSASVPSASTASAQSTSSTVPQNTGGKGFLSRLWGGK